jgi:hypothetical protein
MKTKRMLQLTLVLLGVLLGREAQAFYNPQTGRWLSRDPIGEMGFAKVRRDPGNTVQQQGNGNCYLVVCNEMPNSYDYLGLNPNISPGTVINVDVQGGGSATITVGNHFTPEEQAMARRGLCLVRKLLGSPPFIPPFAEVYWGSFTGIPSDGFTYNGSIFISSGAKPSSVCSFSAVGAFGALLAHEADHYYTGSTDGHSNDPEHRINTPVLNAMNKALSEAICGCCRGQWQLETLLGKYACDCGLTPCNPKPCPKPK